MKQTWSISEQTKEVIFCRTYQQQSSLELIKAADKACGLGKKRPTPTEKGFQRAVNACLLIIYDLGLWDEYREYVEKKKAELEKEDRRQA